MIRHAQLEDAAAIAGLIEPHIDDFALNSSGRDKLNQQAIEELISSASVHYYIYESHQQIQAVIAYKFVSPASSHLIHFFTLGEKQKQGIGRKLWQYIEAELQGASCITVNSSCMAQPVYEKFGFQITSPIMEMNGLRFIQMRKMFNVE